MPTPICVISTTGTSPFTNREAALKDAYFAFAKAHTTADDATKQAIADVKRAHGFAGADLYDQAVAALHNCVVDNALLRRSCAEVNSLLSILGDAPAMPNDQLHFLATDTVDGLLAARVVADFCADYFGRPATLHRVAGLQVRDGKLFRQVGLPQFIDVVYDLLTHADASAYRRVLNPTGGFKGVVPYLTLIGMLEGSDVSYLYEQSTEMITLAPLPLAFDKSRLTPGMVAVLGRLASETPTRTELGALLGWQGRALDDHPAWPLLEALDLGDGALHYGLNGMGRIVLKSLGTLAHTPVWLSRQAWARYESARPGSEERRHYDLILSSIHDAQLRQSNIHTHTGTRWPAYKIGRSNERAFYHDAGDHILVLEFAQHVGGSSLGYDTLPTNNLSDYSQHTRWENQDNAS